MLETPERRNPYRRFMSLVGVDKGWLTGPVYGLTVQIPSFAGLIGTFVFSGQAIEELTQGRPLLLAQALETVIPGRMLEGIAATRELLATGNLEQAGIHALLALGSAALVVGAGFLANQAQLGIEDSQRAEFGERRRNHRSYSPRINY